MIFVTVDMDVAPTNACVVHKVQEVGKKMFQGMQQYKFTPSVLCIDSVNYEWRLSLLLPVHHE